MISTTGEERKAENQDSNAPDKAHPRFFNLALIGIALLSLIPRLVLGVSQYVEYDGYWHVWIAQQTRWANFLWEYRTNAHPPLYFLLLHMLLWLGHTPLVYRSISIVSGTASVYVLGRTAFRAMGSPLWAALAALTYGLALPSIVMSNEVRTYMMSAFLVQVSFYYFLDLTGDRQPSSLRPRVIFAVTAILACLTEYYALIYVGAVMLFALVLPLIRRRERWGSALLREVATFALILGLPAWEYFSHFGAKSVAYDHLPDYYYMIGTPESVADFLWRNLRSELNWFLPWPVPDGLKFDIAVACLLIGGAAIVLLARRRLPRNRSAILILLLPLVMMSAIIAASLMRAYPFGGFLRQQYVLFPFFTICPFLLLDRLSARLPRRVGAALAAALTIAIVGVSADCYAALPKDSGRLLSDEMQRFNRLFPSAAAIYIDQFNLTTFFLHHDDWTWKITTPLNGSVDVYKLSRGERYMVLFRDKDHWILDLREPELYATLAAAMQTWRLPSMTIFCLSQSGLGRTEMQIAAYRSRVAELTAANGLCTQTLDFQNMNIYAEFRRSGTCAGSTAPL